MGNSCVPSRRRQEEERRQIEQQQTQIEQFQRRQIEQQQSQIEQLQRQNECQQRQVELQQQREKQQELRHTEQQNKHQQKQQQTQQQNNKKIEEKQQQQIEQQNKQEAQQIKQEEEKQQIPQQTNKQEKEQQRINKQKEEKQRQIEGRVQNLEQKLKIKIQAQRHERTILSELPDDRHDDLILYKIFNGLTEEICRKLPVVDIINSMGSFVPQKYKTNIKDIGERNGSYAATKTFLTLGSVRKLKTGWSRQLLQTITALDMKDLEELVSLNQLDLVEFYEQIGIPRNSLLHRIAENLRSHCSILVSPMGKNDEDSQAVPVVHPELCVSEDHFARNTAYTDGSYRPLEEGRQAYKQAKRISFNDVTKSNTQTTDAPSDYALLLRKHHHLFLFLIGRAGSGKTTMTKRIVKTCIEEKKMPFLIPFAQIDKDQRLSVKHLLTKFLCRLHNLEHDPSEEEIDQAFNWILSNQDKCLLVFDGLDQSAFEISNQTIQADINDELMPCHLLSLILSRHFLPDVRLVLSSRPHSIAKLSPAIQPQIVVFVNDLILPDAEKLMDHYLEHGTASEIIKKLRFKSPRIHQLVFNPLFLRLVAMLNNEVGENIWTYVNTIAKLFFELIDLLQLSAHHECGLDDDDVKVLNRKLAEMAFYKTMDGSVVFEQKDLERYGLSGEHVQDFLFGVLQSSAKHSTALLVGLMMFFYFNHQSTQEFFSAKYAVESLELEEFEHVIRKLFPSILAHGPGDMETGKDSFAILRVFVIGIINEMKSRNFEMKEMIVKRNFFIKFLCDHLRKVFVESFGVRKHQMQMMVDLMDFRVEEIICEIHEHLKECKFWFDYGWNSPLTSIAHREGFFHFVQNFTTNVKYLEVVIYEWSNDDIDRLFRSINSSQIQIEEMLMIMQLPCIPTINNVISIIPQITDKMRIGLDFRGGEERKQFCTQLEREVNIFDTSKLQTEKLEVEVFVAGRPESVDLHIVLRQGKSP